MPAEEIKIDPIISVVPVKAILFFPIFHKIVNDVSTIFILRSLWSRKLEFTLLLTLEYSRDVYIWIKILSLNLFFKKG